MQSGDGWTICDAGHRHWGLFGAAGLLLTDGDRVLLQHRAPWTHEGDTWGIPGGARDAGETAVQAALREAAEEAGLSAEDIEPLGLFIADHGGWSYTTVAARPRRPIQPKAINAESVTIEWVPIAEVPELALHNGFAQAWPHLQDIPEPVLLVVGPDAADDELIAELVGNGIAVAQLPEGVGFGSLHRLLVQIQQAPDSASAARLAADGSVGWQTILVLDESQASQLRS
jgi:8-oxo-dGTP pyrophosphatase MutT (NUDIX family)